MISIKPYLSPIESLPEEFVDLTVEDIVFVGMHTLIRLRDKHTQIVYYHTLPTGHAAKFPVTFSSDGKKRYYHQASELWMALPLINSVQCKLKINPSIEKIVLRPYAEVIILNCLDYCYGHVLYKLFYAQQYLDTDSNTGLIVIIPTSLRWLMPEGVAEIWTLDTPLAQLTKWVAPLDCFVKGELHRFQQVSLCPANMDLTLATIDIKRFTKVKPFLLNEWSKSPKWVAFICREDRFWLSSKLDQFLYLFSRKFHLQKFFKPYFIRKQNQKMRLVAQLVTQEDTSVRFSAVGLGTSGSLGDEIEDQRINKIPSEELERSWCQLYAKSHLVVGVHGSNMLLPTALAAGFINLLPDFKQPHKGEDVFPHAEELKDKLEKFFSTETTPATVAKQIISMLSQSV